MLVVEEFDFESIKLFLIVGTPKQTPTTKAAPITPEQKGIKTLFTKPVFPFSLNPLLFCGKLNFLFSIFFSLFSDIKLPPFLLSYTKLIKRYNTFVKKL